ncbi:MAG: metallophosphoesterase [Bacteroidales bacterium]
MKKFLKILAVLVFLVIGYLLVLELYPKNANRFPFLVLLLAGDYYLWNSVKGWILRQRSFVKYSLGMLYWLPFMLLVGTSLLSLTMAPEAWNPFSRIYIFGFIFVAYAAKILPVLFLAIADLVRGIQHLHHKSSSLRSEEAKHAGGKKITRSQFMKQAGLISGGIIFAGLFTGMIKWAFDFKVHRHHIRLPHLPLSFNNLRIVQISDIHLGSWASKTALAEAVRKINELEPDIVFFTGDLVNYKTDEAFPFESILGELKAPMGVFATLGNHDYGDYTRWPSKQDKVKNMQDLYDFYDRIGWRLLNNENLVYANPDGKLAVIGVENWGDFSRFPKYGDLTKAMNGAGDADVKLLLSHDPSHWDKIVSKKHHNIDITFAGHTHGFQFGIEIRNITWSPAQYVYKRWAGLYPNPDLKDKQQYLYVNRGLGTIGYPGRVGILPEITVFDLTA